MYKLNFCEYLISQMYISCKISEIKSLAKLNSFQNTQHQYNMSMLSSHVTEADIPRWQHWPCK